MSNQPLRSPHCSIIFVTYNGVSGADLETAFGIGLTWKLKNDATGLGERIKIGVRSHEIFN